MGGAICDIPHTIAGGIDLIWGTKQREAHMRKLILIAAMVLASATAQAGVTRNLALAANDEPAAAEPAKPAETPQFTERPSAVDTRPEAPKAEPVKPAADATTAPLRADKTEKARRRHRSIEARVIYELHRHGIYW
jgi:hypothetical protein